MIRKITVKQLFIISVYILLLVSLSILFIAYSHKNKFYAYFDMKYGHNSVFFSQSDIYNGYDATTDEIHKFSLGEKRKYGEKGEAVYRGSGFRVDTYEIYNRHNSRTFQIIWTWKTANSINYLKRVPDGKYHIEFEKDILGFTHEKYIQGYYLSPKDVYHSCWEYYKEKYKKMGGEETSSNIRSDLLNRYRYYGLFHKHDETRSEYYGNEYFSIQIGHNVCIDEANFDWEIIVEDIVIYFLLILSIPFLIFVITNFRDSRIFCTYLIINVILLLISYHVYNYGVCSINTYKIIWPFTTQILDKEEKEVFLGHDEYGAMLTNRTGEMRIVGIEPVVGYDISEFIVYCFLGYWVYKSRKHNKK